MIYEAVCVFILQILFTSAKEIMFSSVFVISRIR